jgi:hypothetical protein
MNVTLMIYFTPLALEFEKIAPPYASLPPPLAEQLVKVQLVTLNVVNIPKYMAPL